VNSALVITGEGRQVVLFRSRHASPTVNLAIGERAEAPFDRPDATTAGCRAEGMTGCYAMTHRCALSESKWTLAKSWCISEFSAAIREMATPDAAIAGPELRLHGGPADDLELRYTPFDPLPAPNARIVLVGITPGQTQLRLAIAAARQALSRGLDDDEVIRRAKSAAAFGGPMRANLIWMLDRIGLPGALGIVSTETMFAADAHLAVTTSAVCHAVFVHGENWNGQRPNILRHPLTRTFVEQVLAQELRWSPAALVIPLGAIPALAVERCIQTGAVHPTRVLRGLPHPSGANNGRTYGAMFRERLPELQRQVAAWRSQSSS